MVLVLTKHPQSVSSNITAARLLPGARDFVVFCPRCKTLETLGFTNGGLMPTRKFNQRGMHVFHDCGSQEPCRLYRTV